MCCPLRGMVLALLVCGYSTLVAASSDVVVGADSGVVRVRRPHDLDVLQELRALSDESPGGPGPLKCLALSAAEDAVICGTQRGTLVVWSTRMDGPR